MRGTIFIPAARGAFRCLRDPVDEIRAIKPDGVMPALRRVLRGVRAGLRAAGWIAYEAAPAMDPALAAREDCPVPLLWFGLYRRRADVLRADELARENRGAFHLGPWKTSISEARHRADVAAIRRRLAEGATYQVNHTLRLRMRFEGDSPALFLALYRAQPSPYAMYIDAGEHVMLSVSPELFIRGRDGRLMSRPMKGTAPRGRDMRTDIRRARRLVSSVKDRAENVMIVDMVRNDMGRVAIPGSVRARRLFDVESHPTVFQMTSTVSARTTAGLDRIMRAMFPCASVTGAPKVRSMALIRDLETAPRGIYTGCMGYIDAPRTFQFNVAIRTLAIDRRLGVAEYGVGGGIVWDSTASAEYRECLAKAAILRKVG